LISQTLSASIDGLKDSLTASQMNSTMLKTRLKELEANVTKQMSTIRLLDEAIQIIGTGEIKNILRQYTETTFQLESLQEEYDRLLADYNQLFAQLED
jgi:chromosome segregation ATPase